jgi:hypothetical protein
MIKTEVLEIKKQIKYENCSISRIRGCYVDGEKNIKAVFNENFLCLPEEEQFKYLEIFKKTLSGGLGNNLINLDFPMAAGEPGDTKNLLLEIVTSELKEDEQAEELFQRIINTYSYPGNYLVLAIYTAYDIPGKTMDKQELEDASEEVYKYILCSICPVKLSKPGLSYNEEMNQIKKRVQDWVVSAPENGFLFPAFNDRSSDENGLLYYTRDPEEDQREFIEGCLECQLPTTAISQKETFQRIVSETMGENCTYEVIQNIHERLNDLLEEHKLKEIPQPLMLDKIAIKRIFENSGTEIDQLKDFDQIFDGLSGENTLLQVDNIVNTRAYEVKANNVSIKVDPERAKLIKTMYIEGKKCLVIEMENQVEVNGISVK